METFLILQVIPLQLLIEQTIMKDALWMPTWTIWIWVSTQIKAKIPKLWKFLRLRAENAELKRRLREAQSSDEESDDADGKKSWSELGKKRKKQLVRNISKEMEKIAEERRTGVGNIAANILARL